MRRLIYGLDFGTSNSAVAVLKDGKVQVLPVGDRMSNGMMMKSLLFFPRDTEQYFVGEEAVRQYIQSGMKGRLIQSVKSVLPEMWFKSTMIQGKAYKAENLVALILSELKRRADVAVGEDVRSVVLGRPALFSRQIEEDKLATERLLAAVKIAGFEEVFLQLEPVAAAFSYGLSLKRPEIVLVADLGGGTSDFSLLRMLPIDITRNDNRLEVLATRGIHLGGDDFDTRIMQSKLINYFGANAKCESWGQWLPVPLHLMRTICKWHNVPFLKERHERELIRQLISSADDKDALRHLQALVEEDLGFSLFQAIERAKIMLSNREREEIVFSASILDIREPISRLEFEEMIEEDLNLLAGCLEDLVIDSGVRVSEVDSVFITGGISRIPIIRRRFEEKFGVDKIRQGDPFISVATGLALGYHSFFRGRLQ